ncbi:MAG: hypothetical protein HN742_21925 [Lentisphaerae bacterium]|jgi:hypothetical protein|nr:hypothetical protein [Lentisphaerota bacterium]MBT5613156.1 hypothetical protein [Lentisphaerota bacterium]MBT7061940.1 hypothetical protein [Lentisphaerota bacterium]MBT7844552.1 hypothetical protein [Lentisphaerota bacterium]
MKILRLIVLITAIGGLIKGAWMILWPGGAIRIMNWWLDLPERILRIAGGAMVLGGLALIGMAVAYMNVVVAVVTVLGTVAVLAGIAYQWPVALRTVAKPSQGERARYGMRLFGIVIIVVAGGLLFVYMRPH